MKQLRDFVARGQAAQAAVDRATAEAGVVLVREGRSILIPQATVDEIVQKDKAQKQPNRGGRPVGPSMPCGWGCGDSFTATKIRAHFTLCPNRPKS